jgi:2-polyprenyl-3-methyl-5-hydroxy-6-metoxy-1,4-benzoquinol methylase
VRSSEATSVRARLLFYLRRLRQHWRTRQFKRTAATFPLGGHSKGRAIPFVDLLSDQQMLELNRILPWNSFVTDARGRRFGGIAWQGRGEKAKDFPNRRTRLMHEAFNLEGRTVLEVGCLEGVHTLGLCQFGARVTAIDARVENVVKAIVRTSLFDYHPRIFVCNVEERPLPVEYLTAEYCHHVGVLYHLKDPVSHLFDLGALVSKGILLDTHYAAEHEALEVYEVAGERYPFRFYGEFGYSDVFSGMYDHAKWLPLPVILGLLRTVGFTNIRRVDTRMGTHGPRALILAEKSS